jgi:hypothetical protein
VAEEITFHGCKILASARLLDGDTRTGSYLVEKDGRVIRARHAVTWRRTTKQVRKSLLKQTVFAAFSEA